MARDVSNVRFPKGGSARLVPPAREPSLRIGVGNDVHRLAPGRKLVLGGVRIPFDKGPVGHSDGDALVHAICDALLGAAALGDIGRHFPDTSPRWRSARSLVFLREVNKRLRAAGYRVVNLDATVSIERPKLAAYIDRMRRAIARAAGISPSQVSVKAKSGEGLGAVGRGEAVRANAVALITRLHNARRAGGIAGAPDYQSFP